MALYMIIEEKSLETRCTVNGNILQFSAITFSLRFRYAVTWTLKVLEFVVMVCK